MFCLAPDQPYKNIQTEFLHLIGIMIAFLATLQWLSVQLQINVVHNNA
jgi:hypothetical protein